MTINAPTVLSLIATGAAFVADAGREPGLRNRPQHSDARLRHPAVEAVPAIEHPVESPGRVDLVGRLIDEDPRGTVRARE